jgi:multiple sugar transport system substrate-binding protein
MASRRGLLKAAAAGAAIAATSRVTRVRAQQKTLKILEWKHFVPSYNDWLVTYIKEWGEKNDTQVVLDYAGMVDINGRALIEMDARHGHDLVGLVTPASIYEDHVIDHREIYEECRRRFGEIAEFAKRSTFNPKTGKYFGFAVIICRR